LGNNEHFHCLACHQVNGFNDGASLASKSVAGHIGCQSHKDNLADWLQQHQAAALESQCLEIQMTAAYVPGDWNQDIPIAYPIPQPTQVPAAVLDEPDLPMPSSWPVERKHIPIVLPTATDPHLEQERLLLQARAMHQCARELNEFGKEFYSADNEPPEVCAAFEALGK
jgi:hypothetical protein